MPLVYVPRKKKLAQIIQELFVNASSVGAFGTALNVPVPSGVQNGDLLIMCITAASAYTDPVGWTLVSAYTWSYGYHSRIYKRTASNEPAAYSVVPSQTESLGTIMAYRGKTEVDVVGTWSEGLQNLAMSSITTTVPDTILISYAADRSPTSPSAPAGMTSRAAYAGTYLGFRASDQTLGAAGATGTRSAVGGTQYNSAGILFALRGGFDPYWNKVVALLHLDGANGSSVYTDSSSLAKSYSSLGSTLLLSTTQKKFGASSLRTANSGAIATSNRDGAFDFGTEDFTIEFQHFYVPGEAASYGTFFDIGSQKLSVQFGNDTSKMLFYASGGGVTGLSDGVGVAHGMVANTWNHVAAVRHGSNAYLLINGVKQVISTNVSGSIIGSTASSTVAAIGNYSGGQTYSPGGYMDEVRVTKGVARYTADFSVPSAAFTA
jgi:hypothetical protein